MSYFAAVWQRLNPTGSPGAAAVVPTQAQLDPIVQTEMPKIRDGVIKCVGLNDRQQGRVGRDTTPTPCRSRP